MGWNPLKDSWSDVGKKVEGYVKDQGKAQEHLFKAGTFQNNPLEELYKGHYYHQGSHPGVGISTDAWNRVGVNEGNIDETAAGIGAGSGFAFGPFGALIGGVAGAGLGAQMGDENSYKDTLRAMGYGAAGGLAGAAGGEALFGGEAAGGTAASTGMVGAESSPAALAAAEAAAGSGMVGATSSPAALAAAEAGMSSAAPAATMGGDVASLAAAEQSAGLGASPAAGGGNWLTDMVGGGDKMDYLKMLGKGLLGYGQARERQQQIEPYTEANLAAMQRYNQMLANPNAMYQNDPGLRQLRENRLRSLEARQLAAGGGTRGGAYSRQLMSESSDIDRSNMNAMLGQNLAMMGQTNPYVAQMQGLGGSSAGAAYGMGTQMFDDYTSNQMTNQMGEMAFNKFLDYIMG